MKYAGTYARVDPRTVTPFTGVWIEMFISLVMWMD